MAVIGNLAIKLSAQTGGLEKGMKKAEGSVTRFTGAAKKAAMVVGGIGIAAGAAAVGGLAMMVRGQFQAVDASAKMADKLGMTTEGLAGMDLASKLAGVSTDTMTGAMQRMTREIVAAAQGGGAAQGAIARLGLDAERLAKLRPEHQFREITKAMQGVGNQSERILLASKLFGNQRTSMLQIIQGGVDGLDEAQKKATEFGLAVSRIDAAKVEIFNDAMTLLREKTTGAARQIAVNLAPFLTLAAELLGDMQSGVLAWGTSFGGVIEEVSKGVGSLIKQLDKAATLLDPQGRKAAGGMFAGMLSKAADYLSRDDFFHTGESKWLAQFAKDMKAVERILHRSFTKDGGIGEGLVTGIVTRITDRLAEIQREAERLAAAANGRDPRDVPPPFGLRKFSLDDPKEKRPTLRQVRFDRIAAGFAGPKSQPVKVDGMNDVMQIMREMNRSLKRPTPAVATA